MINNLKSDDFSITVTLKPSVYHLSQEAQYEKGNHVIRNALNCMCALDYVDCIEETVKKNLHWHIYIVFSEEYRLGDIRTKFERFLKYYDHEGVIGYIAMRTTYDKANWLSYMHKSPWVPEKPSNILKELIDWMDEKK